MRLFTRGLVVFGATLAVVAGERPALAISRISSIAHSCSELRDVGRQGAVIVTHPGTRGSGLLYDRYVSDSAKCDSGYIAEDDWVPAKGGSCRLTNCQPYEPPFDN